MTFYWQILWQIDGVMCLSRADPTTNRLDHVSVGADPMTNRCDHVSVRPDPMSN